MSSGAYFAEKQPRNYAIEARKQHFKGVKFFQNEDFRWTFKETIFVPYSAYGN